MYKNAAIAAATAAEPLFVDEVISSTDMRDPVVAHDGFTYEREDIERWFDTSQTSPMTGAHLVNITLIPNNSLKRAIEIKAAAVASAVAAAAGAFEASAAEKQKLRTKIGETTDAAAAAADAVAAALPPPAISMDSINAEVALLLFEDPITKKPMVDPVVASDGFTYERSSIQDFIRRNPFRKTQVNSPITKGAMLNWGYTIYDDPPGRIDFIPNLALKAAISTWNDNLKPRESRHLLVKGWIPTPLNGLDGRRMRSQQPSNFTGLKGLLGTPKSFLVNGKNINGLGGGDGGKKRSSRTTRKTRNRNVRGRRASRRHIHRRNVKK